MLLVVLAASCQHKKKLPAVSHIDLSVHIERFDQDLATLGQGNNRVAAQNRGWSEKYGVFYNDFIRHMLAAGDPSDSVELQATLNIIATQKDFHALSKAVERTFLSLERQEKELTEAFRYVRYYFPDYTLPRFISFFSGFSVQAPIGEGYVGIGLDMFLGADSEFYPALIKTVPRYLSRRFTPENITPRVVESVLRQELYPQADTDNNTLQHMVYQGKVLLALDSILPHVNDTLKIGYTGKQLEWAKAYQPEIWSWFLQEELLYSTDYLRIQKYFTEGPFTAELGEHNESAPKLGTYLGWMMIRRYMEQHPDVTLRELLAETNAQDILEKSKFRGK